MRRMDEDVDAATESKKRLEEGTKNDFLVLVTRSPPIHSFASVEAHGRRVLFLCRHLFVPIFFPQQSQQINNQPVSTQTQKKET